MITSEKDKQVIKEIVKQLVLIRVRVDKMDLKIADIIELVSGGYVTRENTGDVGSQDLDSIGSCIYPIFEQIHLLLTGKDEYLPDEVYEVTDREDLSVDKMVDIIYEELTK